MRIALVSDTYTPQVNGVTTVVARIRDVLRAFGHQVVIVAPRYPGTPVGLDELRIPSAPFPPYPAIRLSLPQFQRGCAVGVLADLTEHSLLIVLADHGGGGVSSHIPLILAGPDVTRHHLRTRQVSLLDVAPTVLWWFGLDVPVTYEGRVLTQAFTRFSRPTEAAV